MKMVLHPWAALSHILFIIIMDVLAEEARTKPPYAMPLADARERNGRGSRGRTGKTESHYREQGVEN